MATEHRNIVDAERHEAKGANSASAGQVLRANGDATTSFVNPSTLNNITIGSTIEGQSFINQNPSAVDTPLQVVWGAGSSNADINIASNGVVTFTTTGLYSLTISANFGRTTGAGTAILAVRLLVNGAVGGFTQVLRLSDSTATIPFLATVLRKFNSGDTLTMEVMRDSAGINNGGLQTVDITPVGWADAPSAAIRLQKITGGF